MKESTIVTQLLADIEANHAERHRINRRTGPDPDRDYFTEAYEIVEGNTMLRPEKAHVEALVRELERMHNLFDTFYEELNR